MTAEKSAEVRRARTELVATLNAIEDRLNVPKRVLRQVQRTRAEKPAVFYSAVAGAVGALGAVGWLAVRVLGRR